jgi:hypothetical protein
LTRGPFLVEWLKRTLDEELNLEPIAVNFDSFRLLGVFLEADLPNVSLCGSVELKISSEALDSSYTADRERTMSSTNGSL